MKETFETLVEHFLGNGFFLEEAVEMMEKTLIQRALERTKGNQSAAAKLLGIHRNTLQRKMVDYGLRSVRTRRMPASRETVRARVRTQAV